jgi:tetratricopeptide (TPR) repeat protein
MSTSAALVVSMLTLHREGRTGVVTIKSEGVTTFVYLRDGVAVFAEEGTTGETLGRLLVRQQLLTQAQYVEILGTMTDALVLNEQLRFGEVATELGYLSEEQVRRALRDQVRWKIVLAFQRADSTWEFEDSPSRVDDAGHFPMHLESLVLEAVRWFDDDQKMELGLARALDKSLCIAPGSIPGLAERFGFSAAEQAFAARLDGTRTTRALLADADADAVDTRAVVTALFAARVAIPATLPRPVAVAPIPVPSRQPKEPPATPPAALGATPEPASASAKRPGRIPVSRTSQILEALGAQRVKVDLQRDPVSGHEAKLLAERAFQAGVQHMKSGRYQLASPELERAVRLLPSSFEYRLHEKWCAIRGRGEPPHGVDIAELRRLTIAALAANPNLAFGCCVAGELALDDGNEKQALKMLRRAEKLDPDLLEAKRLIRVAERRLSSGKGP